MINIKCSERAKDIINDCEVIDFEISEITENSNDKLLGKFIINSITPYSMKQLYVIREDFISDQCMSFSDDYHGYYNSKEDASKVLNAFLENMRES